MSDIEFFAKLAPKRLSSLDDDLKAWRNEFQEDEKRNAQKRAGKIKIEPLETIYERDSDESQ